MCQTFQWWRVRSIDNWYNIYKQIMTTSAKEVMFLPEFVCLLVNRVSVCLLVSKITQKVFDGFWWNFQVMLEVSVGTNNYIFVEIRLCFHLSLFVCLSLSRITQKTYQWIFMKFSGHGGTVSKNKSLKFWRDPIMFSPEFVCLFVC